MRTNQGYETEKYQIPSSPSYTSIKAEVDSRYNANSNIKYIVLFGAVEEVPSLVLGTHFVPNDDTSDIAYGLINGTYQIIVGRISSGDGVLTKWVADANGNPDQANYEVTSWDDTKRLLQVTTTVDKIIEYENIIDQIQAKHGQVV